MGMKVLAVVLIGPRSPVMTPPEALLNTGVDAAL
jgi:hypothetical protein